MLLSDALCPHPIAARPLPSPHHHHHHSPPPTPSRSATQRSGDAKATVMFTKNVKTQCCGGGVCVRAVPRRRAGHRRRQASMQRRSSALCRPKPILPSPWWGPCRHVGWRARLSV
ncbi:hypothetical protein E2C01_021532 [Portunus trituberculatus]|uniref:Uncharacterized protein n=1 Tax=Portunus trituberculatus TaxID=210409 RepID=A0A5B7E2V3_PORTR|nr:hypothetical protein [Portunus trituberculatus]